MSWIVDTCVLIDVLDEDPRYGKASAVTLQELLPQGLAVSPISFIELSPAFMGDPHAQLLFFRRVIRGVSLHLDLGRLHGRACSLGKIRSS